jgi:arylformamidase
MRRISWRCRILQLDEIFTHYRTIDLTLVLEEGTPCYLPYYHMVWMSRKMGDGYNAYVLQIPEHHATHVDAPSHVGGAKWLDDVEPDTWHGPCRVINLESKKMGGQVSAAEIKKWEKTYGDISRDEIVLLKYGWDKRWAIKSQRLNRFSVDKYLRDFPGLSVEAAAYLGKRKVRMVGTDTPTVDSISAFLDAHNLGKVEPAHVVLLRDHGIPILEGLKNLRQLPPNGAYLFAFPLNIKHGSGSPVRAIAFVARQ